MRSSVILAVLVLVSAATAARAAEKRAGAAKAAAPVIGVAHLKSPEGKALGDALLRETPNGVLVTVKLTGLPPGPHAFHVHEHGKCEPPFESAGGHFNPEKKHHGYDNPQGFHAGDLPNLFVDADGAITAEFLARNLTLAPGKPNSLLDKDGSALVVHGKADDYRSDPAGAAGDRIACGAVERPVAAASGKEPAERPTAGSR